MISKNVIASQNPRGVTLSHIFCREFLIIQNLWRVQVTNKRTFYVSLRKLSNERMRMREAKEKIIQFVGMMRVMCI